MGIHNQKGAALYTVLVLSTVALVLILVFIKTQNVFSLPSIRNSHRLQALLNARSGIWYGLSIIQKNSQHNFLKNRNEYSKPITDSLFNTSMFEEEKIAANDKDSTKLVFFDSTIIVIPFDSSFGKFTLSISKDMFFIKLKSEGIVHSVKKIVEADIASKPFENGDTVLFLENSSPVQGAGFVEGRKSFLEKSIDSSSKQTDERFFIDMEQMNEIVNNYEEALSSPDDTALLEPPVTIFYEDDFKQMPDTIRGPLFFDGSSRDLTINGNSRSIVVLEDLQITGTVDIDNITFIVDGDIKILDKSYLKKSSLYTNARLFIGGKSRFSGSAISKNLIEIYDDASVENKSFLLCLAETKKSPIAKKDSTSSTAKDSSANKLFSINLRNRAMVDGILLDLSKNMGGILTEPETIFRGILWSNSRVCHQGEMEGILKAKILADLDNLSKTNGNYLLGDIKILDSINDYLFPTFFGKPELVHWREL